MHLWDTAGQEKYRSISSIYFRGADGVIVVYDITNRSSFDHLSTWLKEVEDNIGSDCQLMLVGNKSDLSHNRAVFIRDVQAFTTENGLSFVETSALTGDGIDKAFHNLLMKVYKLRR